MLQTIIALLIVTAAVIAAIAYIARGLLRIRNKETSRSCCSQKNVCKDDRGR
jgi:Tfp pilus assembly protein PilV